MGIIGVGSNALGASSLELAEQELKAFLKERCITDKETTQLYGKDFSFHEGKVPDVVCYPNDIQEIKKIVDICANYSIPIIPFGSGTSLEGHINATKGGVCIVFANMSKVLSIQAQDFTVTVQPGITYDELNKQLKEYGLFFSPDPGPGASVGGMVGKKKSILFF